MEAVDGNLRDYRVHPLPDIEAMRVHLDGAQVNGWSVRRDAAPSSIVRLSITMFGMPIVFGEISLRDMRLYGRLAERSRAKLKRRQSIPAHGDLAEHLHGAIAARHVLLVVDVHGQRRLQEVLLQDHPPIPHHFQHRGRPADDEDMPAAALDRPAGPLKQRAADPLAAELLDDVQHCDFRPAEGQIDRQARPREGAVRLRNPDVTEPQKLARKVAQDIGRQADQLVQRLRFFEAEGTMRHGDLGGHAREFTWDGDAKYGFGRGAPAARSSYPPDTA